LEASSFIDQVERSESNVDLESLEKFVLIFGRKAAKLPAKSFAQDFSIRVFVGNRGRGGFGYRNESGSSEVMAVAQAVVFRELHRLVKKKIV
jgi:hypothetical protein